MEEIQSKIETLIEESINPALVSHNGFVELVAIEPKEDYYRVVLTFMGGCAGCPGAAAGTLWSIQEYLNEELDGTKVVVVNSEYE